MIHSVPPWRVRRDSSFVEFESRVGDERVPDLDGLVPIHIARLVLGYQHTIGVDVRIECSQIIELGNDMTLLNGVRREETFVSRGVGARFYLGILRGVSLIIFLLRFLR